MPTSKERPAWLRWLMWLGIAFLLFNVGSLVLFFLMGSITRFVGAAFPLAVIGGTLAVPIWGFHVKNVLTTWGNKPTADFDRHDDPATGAQLFHVRPARAARTPAMFLFAAGVLLLLVSAVSFWIYLMALLFLVVGCTFVVPGARYRRPVTVTVSPNGIQSEDIAIPLASVADLRVGHNGLVIDPDAPMPGRNGVPISSMVGRHMGRRQAERGYTVEIRADGEGHSSVLAGGLTLDCATALVADIGKAKDSALQAALA